MYSVQITNTEYDLGRLPNKFPTLEEAHFWIEKCKAKKRPWGCFNARDLLKEDCTEYDLTLITETYYTQDEFEDMIPKERVKLKQDYVVEITDVTEEFDAEQVLENRRKEYGSVEDQLDLMYHDFDAWKSHIKSIKEKYPKKIK